MLVIEIYMRWPWNATPGRIFGAGSGSSSQFRHGRQTAEYLGEHASKPSEETQYDINLLFFDVYLEQVYLRLL